VILVPAGAVTTSQVEDGLISPGEAKSIADATLIQFLISRCPGLPLGAWDDAVLGDEMMVIHDLNNQPLFYQFTVVKNGIIVGSVRISASSVLPSTVASIGLKPSYMTWEQANQSARSYLLRTYPGSEVISTYIICYSYPKMGQKITFLPLNRVNPEEIILDIATGEPVEENATWSYYRSIPESAILKNRDQWMKERAIESIVLAEARKGKLERPSSLQDIDLEALAGTLRSIPEYESWIDQRFSRDTADMETTGKAGTITIPITLRPQQKDTWCTVATIQMIA